MFATSAEKLLVHPCLWATRKRWRQAGMKKNNCLRRNISCCRKFLTSLSEGSLPLSVFGCFSNIHRYSLREYWRVEVDPGLVLDELYDWTMSSEGRIMFFFPLNCKKIVLVRWLNFRDKTAILRLHCPRES